MTNARRTIGLEGPWNGRSRPIAGLSSFGIAFALAVFAATLSASACADPPKPLTEAQAKKLRISEILREGQPLKAYEPNAPFCPGLLKALLEASPAVQFVEPVVATDDPRHPALARYHSCDDRFRSDRLRPDTLEFKSNSYSGLAWDIGHRAFRIFRIDLDGNPRNGLEEVIYGERDTRLVRQAQCGRICMAGFYRIDVGRCAIRYSSNVTQRELSPNESWDSHNALIKYAGRYRVFELERNSTSPQATYSLRVGDGLYSNAPKAAQTCIWQPATRQAHSATK